ncbi:hypothetical protein E2562_030635 [Oryza meyeriana var. granulata]|uniref:Uncharacterized protein n=1 Tax=Oryza meyeriana var. granulata TaxID=110450 RepID=A0A6G1CJX4_9ORYZ|nr:hypothetical protein E2562_030635 [Oryza meyeriana var. granulata]
MAWIEIEDIGGGTLFLDYRASMAMPSSEAGHGNRIYFRSLEQFIVLYSKNILKESKECGGTGKEIIGDEQQKKTTM